MKNTIFRSALLLVLFGALVFSYGNCQRLKTELGGTGTGNPGAQDPSIDLPNPPSPDQEKVIGDEDQPPGGTILGTVESAKTICQTLERCHNIRFETCLTSLDDLRDMGPALGYVEQTNAVSSNEKLPTFKEVQAQEKSGFLKADQGVLAKCLIQVKALSCTEKPVQYAYDPTSSRDQPYKNASWLLSANDDTCSRVFRP